MSNNYYKLKLELRTAAIEWAPISELLTNAADAIEDLQEKLFSVGYALAEKLLQDAEKE